MASNFRSAFKNVNVFSYLLVVILTLIIGWLLFRPREASVTEQNDMAITRIQAIGKMELAKLTIKDVLDYNIKRDYLPDSKLLLVVTGEMAGCIDLTKLKPEDIQRSDSSLRILLPRPEICYYKIDHKRSRIYNAMTFIFLDNDMEITQEAYRRAEAYFQSDSLNNIVYKETEQNAEKILKPLFETITKKKVELTFGKHLRSEKLFQET